MNGRRNIFTTQTNTNLVVHMQHNSTMTFFAPTSTKVGLRTKKKVNMGNQKFTDNLLTSLISSRQFNNTE